MSKLAAIQQILDQIEQKRLAESQQNQSIREAAIALIQFITDTIKVIDPARISVAWYGSYSNSGVGDYPHLTVQAIFSPTHVCLAEWRINAGGTVVPPQISSDDIQSAVLAGLQKISS